MRGKIFFILLLLGIVFSSVITHVLFQIERICAFSHFCQIKNTEGPDVTAIFIYTGQPGFHWEKSGKEFSFNGKLYDVISIKDTGTEVVINCIADQKEDYLVASYLKLIDTAKSKKDWVSLLKLKSIYAFPVGIFVLHNEILYSNNVIVLNSILPTSPYREIISPPPEHYSSHFVG